MPANLIPRAAVTGLLLSGATAFALALAPAALASPMDGPQELLPLPTPQEPVGPPSPEPEVGEDDGPIVEIPDGLLCEITDTCEEEEPAGEDGEDGEGEGEADEEEELPSEDCEFVHTPFGKIWTCDGEEPEAPEGCDYLLDLEGNWKLECPDDTPPPPEDCEYVLDLQGNWQLECPDDTPPPPEGCDYLLDLEGNWKLECPDDTPDPCEQPTEEAGSTEECDDEPEETPGDREKPGLPLTGPSAILTLVSLGGLLAAGGGTAIFLSRRRASEADDLDGDGEPVTE